MRRGPKAAGTGIARASVLGAVAAILGLSLLAAGMRGGGGSADVVRAGDRAGDRQATYWSTREAESIATVRGLPVHVKQCRGLGHSRRGLAVVRYSRFACTAGTGLDWDAFDTVSVTYVLVPLGRYEGGCSSHALRDVHFVGGTGIP